MKSKQSLLSMLFVSVFTLGTMLQPHLMAEEKEEVRINADGSKYIKKADGSSVEIKPDGTKLINEADGTSIQVKPDGTKIVKKPDGSVITVESPSAAK
jgi:hypothetical protein